MLGTLRRPRPRDTSLNLIQRPVLSFQRASLITRTIKTSSRALASHGILSRMARLRCGQRMPFSLRTQPQISYAVFCLKKKNELFNPPDAAFNAGRGRPNAHGRQDSNETDVRIDG